MKTDNIHNANAIQSAFALLAYMEMNWKIIANGEKRKPSHQKNFGKYVVEMLINWQIQWLDYVVVDVVVNENKLCLNDTLTLIRRTDSEFAFIGKDFHSKFIEFEAVTLKVRNRNCSR